MNLDWHFSWWTVVALAYAAALVLALLSIPSVLLKRRGRPHAAISWLLILLSFPPLGLFLWWAIGRQHLERKRKKKRRAAKRVTRRLAQLRDELPSPPEAEWSLMPIRQFPSDDADWMFVPTRDNCVRLLIDTEAAYPAIEQIIREAKDHLHLIFYIWRNDATGRRFRDLLVEKARDGVNVRVLLDAYGAMQAAGRFMKPLRDAGGEVQAFRPIVLNRLRLEVNFRNHRKLILADGRKAIIGGFNIGDEYANDWHDVGVALEGPVIDQLQEVFLEDWAYASGLDFELKPHFGRWRRDGEADTCRDAICGVVASGPHTELNLTHEACFTAITGARKRIWITTPYFVPDQTITAALRSAAFRGVDVRLLTPEISDSKLVALASRSYYPELLRMGVRIFEFQGRVLHSKSLVLDDDLCFVGSANMDIRSFRLNFELGSFIKSEAFTRELAELFERDLEQSREIDLTELEGRGRFVQLVEAAAHLLSPLL